MDMVVVAQLVVVLGNPTIGLLGSTLLHRMVVELVVVALVLGLGLVVVALVVVVVVVEVVVVVVVGCIVLPWPYLFLRLSFLLLVFWHPHFCQRQCHLTSCDHVSLLPSFWLMRFRTLRVQAGQIARSS
jgi:hypothetical protein